jgi:uncharacterized protein YqeY
MLHEQIKSGIKEAMMERDAVRLETLRAMVAGFTNELVAKNRKPNEMLEDADALAVITRLAKQRKDSIEQFKKGKTWSRWKKPSSPYSRRTCRN